MKKRVCMLLLAALLLLCFPAAALELPSIECFSPGLIRLSEAMRSQEAVSAEAELTVENAFYARDLSLLNTLLSGTTFHYDAAEDTDRLTIVRDGEALSSFALTEAEDGVLVELEGKTYPVESAQALISMLTGDDVSQEEIDRAQAAEAFLNGTPILERAPLAEVAAWLEGLSEGDALAGGFAVTQAFALERTMSDDGTRLTRIDITGAIGREGETPWVVTGFLRQPAGRSPKDTFEITVKQDDANYIELSYSALYESSVTRKNKEGTVSVSTTLKAAGKIAGSAVTSRLSVRTKNSWTSDGESLSEKITVTATLTHQDKTPGRRMQRLNDVSATLKNVISIKTGEETAVPVELSDDVTLEVVMDSNTFLNGGAKLRVSVGGEAADIAAVPEDGETTEFASAQELAEAAGEAVQALSAKLYARLSESAREKLTQGL